jgi:hypothetical protein
VGGIRAKTGWGPAAVAILGLTVASNATADERSKTEIRAIRPDADTYVSAAQPRRNFGRTTALHADGSPLKTAFLRFRIGKPKGDIKRVMLLLHAQTGARSSYQVRRVRENAWRERGLTYENAPRLSLRYASSKPIHRGAWNAVDVTAFVADEDREISLAITTRSPIGVVFSSRESSRGPRLVLRTDGVKAKASPPTP